MSFFFKSEDSRRQDATARKTKQGKTRCPACDGTGTFGIGGRGSMTSRPCSKCKGEGYI